jgi:hypothetical protein
MCIAVDYPLFDGKCRFAKFMALFDRHAAG